MIEARPYPREKERLESLKALKLLDTPIEERFEQITRRVCKLLNVPIALFNLLDEDRQHYKSAQGLTNINAPLDAAFCTHALHEPDMLLVPNAHVDERFHDNPFVTGEYLDVGFYAGCPVRTADGMPIGTLCAIDTKPREMSAEQLTMLRDLAAMVENELNAGSLSEAQLSLKEELSETQRLTLIDPLTRLWNRNGIMNLLDKEWSVAAREKKPLTLVMVDIDQFKTVNDIFNRDEGDIVLKNAAKRMLEYLRTQDALGRIGGEEFLIVLTDCSPDAVFDSVERIRLAIDREPIIIGQKTYGTSKVIQSYPVTMSFGAATTTPSNGTDIAKLSKRASEALSRAKKGGRNRVAIA